MTDLPADLTALGPTAGVLIVVWAFLRYLSQQREAAGKESHEEREMFSASLDKISATNERVMERVSGRVESLAEAQIKLAEEIRRAIETRAS